MIARASLLIAAGLSSVQAIAEAPQPAAPAPSYIVHVSVAEPDHVRFTMQVPSWKGVLTAPLNSVAIRIPPACGDVPLTLIAARQWIKPLGCEQVSWSATISSLDGKTFDASRPGSFWSARRQTWLLSGDLPWLRYMGQSWSPVHVIAENRTGFVAKDTSLPGAADSPTYILIGEAKRDYKVGSVVTTIYGDIPARPQSDRLQRIVGATLARWQRDLLPDDAPKRDRFNYMWFAESNGAEPGFFASTGSDAILMQFVPDPRDRYPYAKLDAGILLTGAHEGFHELAGVLSNGKPTWVNESWASYFAYATARHVLTGPALTAATQLFQEPASISVLHAQELLDQGDASGYEVFYTRAARFWAAIDDALTNRPNETGRLAALIKQSHGMRGVKWNDPISIAAFFDLHTAGRAKSIVQCYLVQDRCADDGVHFRASHSH